MAPHMDRRLSGGRVVISRIAREMRTAEYRKQREAQLPAALYVHRNCLPMDSPDSKASLFSGSSFGFLPSLCSMVFHTTSSGTTCV